jgi:hypothetical protein
MDRQDLQVQLVRQEHKVNQLLDLLGLKERIQQFQDQLVRQGLPVLKVKLVQ